MHIAIMEQKREAIPERMRSRNEMRQAELNRRREKTDSTLSSQEQVIQFVANFASAQSQLELLLSQCNSISKVNLAEHLDHIKQELYKLQKLVSDAQLFIPPFEKEMANVRISALRQKLLRLQESLTDKKFTFKSRKKTNKMAAGDELDNCQSTIDVHPFRNYDSEIRTVNWAVDCGFADISSQTLVKHANEVNGTEIVLQHLDKCTVKLYGCPSTVQASDLTDCVILVGPVSTSVFVNNCKRVLFAAACQQLRVHSSVGCDFYVHVTSRSVIEDSKQLRFAPYSFVYDGIEQHFEQANLNKSVNNWKLVDDFDWLALDKSSPHWSVLEEMDRVQLDLQGTDVVSRTWKSPIEL